MSNLNKVFLMGNLTRDIEVRFTPKGMAVTSFSIAINRQWNTDDGEKKEEVTFIDITAWGKRAEFIGKYFSKGKPIFIEGYLNKKSWEDKDGKKQYKTEVIAENVQFVGKKEETKSDVLRDEDGTPIQNSDKDVPF